VDTVQVSCRVQTAWVQRAEAVAERIHRFGGSASTASVFRAAIAIGLEALEKEHGIRGKR
jgi:hypothetical protein